MFEFSARRVLVTFAVIALSACAVSAASAQTRDENAAKCAGADPDIAIRACTALIQSGLETPSDLAKDYLYRGSAYQEKGDLVRAREDYTNGAMLANANAFSASFKPPAPSSATAPPGAIKARMPTARWAAGLGEINGVIYVAGGYNPALGGHLTAFEAYNVATNTFSSRASQPGIQTGAVAGAINGVLYVAGGSDCCVNTRSLTAYTVASNSWASRNAPSSSHGNSPAGGVIGRLFYIAGGGNLDGSSSVSVLEAYDPLTDIWTVRAPMPTARQAVGSVVLGGKLYVVGGRSSSLGILSTVEAYDPATNTWATKARMLTPRSELVVGVLNGILYAVGGSTAAGPVAIVEAYDPATNKWKAMPAMATARRGAQGAVVNGKLYVIGGYATGDTALSTLEVVTP